MARLSRNTLIIPKIYHQLSQLLYHVLGQTVRDEGPVKERNFFFFLSPPPRSEARDEVRALCDADMMTSWGEEA